MKYWQEEFETMPRQELKKLQDERLVWQVTRMYEKVELFRKRMDEMGLKPMLLLGMRLGEGSGCPLAFTLLDAACAVINNMASFDEAGIDDSYLDDIRIGDKFSVEV